MSKLLEDAFRKARELPKDAQDRLGAALLASIAEDERWEEALNSPQSLALLEDWAAEALDDFHAGRTEELNPDSL